MSENLFEKKLPRAKGKKKKKKNTENIMVEGFANLRTKESLCSVREKRHHPRFAS